MSRLGKKTIIIPENTEVNIGSDGVISVKGKLGEISRTFKDDVAIVKTDNEITLKPANDTPFANMLWGTYSSLLNSMIKGVNELFEKKLIIEGVGYKWSVAGDSVDLALGFSHPVKVVIPKDLTVTVEKNNMTVAGVNKELVGKFAADIRDLKKPEPYKGKGIRYEDEVIRRKQGKKSV